MKKFKVGFELSLVSPEHGGTFQYSFYILGLLKNMDQIEKVYLFCEDKSSIHLAEFREHEKFTLIEVKPFGPIKRKLKKASDFFINRFMHKQESNKFLYKLYRFLNPDTYYFNNFDIDVLHVPWQVSRVFGIKVPVLVTIHDLQQLYFPEFFGPFERMQRALTFTKSILRSDQVISSFAHVKTDVQKYFHVNDDQTSVCPVPVATECFTSNDYTRKEELTARYNMPEEFILTPAATWPHKNHLGVLHALKILKDKGRKVYWIATGVRQSHYKNVIAPTIEELGLTEQVQFTDIVSQEDLIGFYKTTRLVVMPTLYEAGSGPLFESMRFGVPVICSNVTSLPESIEDMSYVFDPHNYDQMAEMIERGLDDEAYRAKNVINSGERIDFYAKFNYYQPIIDAYNKAIAVKQQK